MDNFPDTMARIKDYASRHNISPRGVVRKATGDPRGLDRLAKKIEDIRAVNLWLDQNDVTSGEEHGDNRHSVQEVNAKLTESGPRAPVERAG